MCGIAGFSSFTDQKWGDKQTLKQMGEAIFHRGPDAGGEFIDQHTGLSHRRLSIIDLSEAGNQPLYSADEQLVLVFNGEIYNFLELRDTLSKQGYTFRTQTDSEVILALYQQQGVEMLQQLNGMFAIALWDKVNKQLLLARDRIGKKPLYYYHQAGRLAFASEIKALLTLPDIPREVRLDAVYDFFAYQYVPDPKSIFQDIHKLPPAHYMLFSEQGCEIKRYWQLSFAKQSTASEAELTEQLQQQAKACTARRMISDVPLGAFLSGGVDSSGVVALMAQQSKQPVKTCSIGFDVEQFNETEFAKAVAQQYKTEHHEFTVHQNVAENLEHIVSFFDEPFADPSLVPTYFVSQLARQEVTVAVAGDGGDEVFAGYQKYSIDHIENRLRSKFPRWLRKGCFPWLAELFAKSHFTPFRKAKSLLTSLSLEPAMGFYLSNANMEDRLWDKLATPETKAALGNYHPSQITLDAYQQADGSDHLAKILYTDMQTYLPGGILVKVDRMSMANSLEVRAPILDKEMLEFSATVPSSLKFKDGEKKHILKQAFKPLLPDDILYRKKMGFSVPLADWLRAEIHDLAKSYLFDQSLGLHRYFNMSVVQQLWDEHQQQKTDHSHVLWSMLMLQMWWKRYMPAEPNSESQREHNHAA